MVGHSFEDKVAVITGGAQGIGLAIAESFLRKGVKTAVILDVKPFNEIADKLNARYGLKKAVYMECDVTKDLDTVSSRIFDKYKVDILVNNAGIGDETDVRRLLEVNTIAVIEWSLKFQQHMSASDNGGTIINISSGYGFHIDQFVPVYKASKFAVMGFSRSLGHMKNFNRSKVRVIVICPGITDTSFDNIFSYGEDVTVEWDEFKKSGGRQPAEAVGKAAVEVYENAASGTAWLISESKPIVEIN